MSDHPRDCPHGRQWGKCDTCDLIEANKRIAALEAEVERLRAVLWQIKDQIIPDESTGVVRPMERHEVEAIALSALDEEVGE